MTSFERVAFVRHPDGQRLPQCGQCPMGHTDFLILLKIGSSVSVFRSRTFVSTPRLGHHLCILRKEQTQFATKKHFLLHRAFHHSTHTDGISITAPLGDYQRQSLLCRRTTPCCHAPQCMFHCSNAFHTPHSPCSHHWSFLLCQCPMVSIRRLQDSDQLASCRLRRRFGITTSSLEPNHFLLRFIP